MKVIISFCQIIKKLSIILLLLISKNSFAQLNMNLVSHLSYDSIFVNDIWGYVAPDGTEYALVCNRSEVSIVNLSDPANPIESAFVEGYTTDIKTFGEYAYAVGESGDGLKIIDLSMLPESVESYNWSPAIPEIATFSDTLNNCHNIYIDDFGYAYLTGCSLNNGGLIYIDVFTEPGFPRYINAGFPTYSHDVYVRDNIAYSSEIYNGTLSIYDVSDKEVTELLGQVETPAQFTHSAWLTDDGKHIFATDERANASIISYNIEDLNDIKEQDQFRPFETIGAGVIPHNVHVWQDWIIASYYEDGCIIIDATHGAFGAYPYLPSGLILISDIDAGLYVFEPTYIKACYLEGNITSADTGTSIPNAEVRLLDTKVLEKSNLMGVYKTGSAIAGTYEVEVSHPYYESKKAEAILENGELTILDFELTPLPSFAFSGVVMEENGEALPLTKIKIEGELVNTIIETDAEGKFTIPVFYEGTYTIYVGKWGYKQIGINAFNASEFNNNILIELEKGIEDGFEFDFGWTVENESFYLQTGGLGNPPWVRGIPNGLDESFLFPDIIYQLAPLEDSPNDVGTSCYATGNDWKESAELNGLFLGGSTTLSSPVFDLSNFNAPYIVFDAWVFATEKIDKVYKPTQEKLQVYLTNGVDTIAIDSLGPPQGTTSTFNLPISWENREIEIQNNLEFTENMQIIFDLSYPYVPNNIPDATIFKVAVDHFQVFDADPVSTIKIKEIPNQFIAFPNPSSNTFTINYELTRAGELFCFNSLGQIVEQITLEDSSGQITLGKEWTAGIYLTKIIIDDQLSQTLKLVKH